jgi:hypothetical protein
MFRRPSPSPSTACCMKLVGMNWVCPMAPAQEPRMAAGSAWPCSIISSATRSSLRKKSPRYLV